MVDNARINASVTAEKALAQLNVALCREDGSEKREPRGLTK